MVEQHQFNSESWFQNLALIASRPSIVRYEALCRLHDDTLHEYIGALQNMTAEQASEMSSDGRTRALIVGHILGWEEWQTQVLKNQNPLEQLKLQMQYKGYTDPESGETLEFNSVDDFNAFLESKYACWSWHAIRGKAITAATEFKALFTEDQGKSWVDFLDHTPEKNWKMSSSITIPTTQGWYVWMVSLKHEVIEHRKDLLM